MVLKIGSLRIGIGLAIFFVLLAVKLTGVVNWSWWWITAPLWIPLGLTAIGVTGLNLMTDTRKV